MRRWAAAALLIVAALLGGVTGQRALAGAAAAIVLGALTFGARLSLTPLLARVSAVVAAAAGGALGWILVPAPGQPLRPPWPSFALAGVFAGAALLCKRDVEKSPATALVPGLAALAACGEASLGWIYPVLVAAHLTFLLLALRAGDPKPGPLPRRRLAAGAAIVALSAILAGGFAWVLPPLSQWTERRVLQSLGSAEAGFSDRLWLGSLQGMLQSDEVVLRLDGAPADYLRGAVYDHYEIGRWGRLHQTRVEPWSPSPPGALPPSASRARITVVSGMRDRYFVPLAAHAITAAEPALGVDRFGVVRVLGGSASEVSFEPGGPSDLHVEAPTEDDLKVPPALRPPLERIAREWTLGASTPEEKALAIAHRLRTTFTYSLHFDHRRRRDPLLDFLLDDRRGHCEYFASAMTLLSRAAGVPARVAVGYRVAEENPFGHYRVVREKNAHAWSEVFLEGRGFVTVDATPEGAVAQNERHEGSWLGSLWDLAGYETARAFARLTLLDVAGALLVVVAAGFLLRALGRRRGPRAAKARRAALEKPPPGLSKLLDALARRGAVRPASEPLEQFAGRLEEKGMEEPAAVLRRWAAFRYGSVGDGEGLAKEMERWAERLGR